MAEHTTVTPAGFRIVFEDGAPNPKTGKAKRRAYLIDGEKLVSVTTVLGILDKPGLVWAAEKLTVQAAIELARNGELPMHVDGALSRMRARELRFRQVWDAKAKRGAVAHDDLVKVATGQQVMDVDQFPADQRGFIRGLSGWFADERPVVLATEVFVASVEHGFAGRFDLLCRLPRRHPTAVFRVDVKTTETLPRDKAGQVKPPYDEHLFQLAGYELAAVESGYPASDFQAVLRVDATGQTDLFTTIADPDDFLAVLGAYRAVRGRKAKRIDPQEMVAA